MNPKSAVIFSLACLLTGIGWAICWPRKIQETARPLPREPVVETTWEKGKTETLLATLDAASSDDERLQAAMRLDQIPQSEIQAILESIELFKDLRLNLPAKTLLIRWATSDGDVAVKWAWQHFRGKPAWMDAFREIGPAWAWRDPTGFGKWVLARIEARSGKDDISLDEANASDEPLLDFGNLSQISGWLFKEDPRLAMEIFLKRGGFSTHDDQMWKSLNDPRRIEQALLAFSPETIEPLKSRDGTGSYSIGDEIHAEELMRRWREIDPEGFAKSSYAVYLLPQPFELAKFATREWTAVPPVDRAKAATEILQRTREPFRFGTVGSIAKEWAASDPESCRGWLETLPENEVGLGASEFVHLRAAGHLDETLDWTERFKPELRAVYLVRAFDAWSSANPGGRAETSGWSGARREAWEDLEALNEAVGP